MEFVTVKKSDPLFESLMLGTFSKNQRALPVRSYRGIEVARDQDVLDQMTFELVPIEKVRYLPLWRILLKASRPELLPLSLYPLISVICLMVATNQIFFAGRALLAMLAIVSLHASVFLMNDASDHLKGLDAVSLNRGSRVIQNGHLTAKQMQNWAGVFLAWGALLGIPCVLLSARWLPFIAALAPLAMVGFNHRRFGLKYWGLGDGLIFLFFGPLLTAGFALATSTSVPFWIWHLGIIWGWLSVVIFQLRSFENIFADGLVRSGTFLSRLGFDHAKKFLAAQLVTFLLVWASWAVEIHKPWLWLPTAIYVGAVCYLDISKIWMMRSPLSSVRKNMAQIFLFRLILAPFILVGITWLAVLK